MFGFQNVIQPEEVKEEIENNIGQIQFVLVGMSNKHQSLEEMEKAIPDFVNLDYISEIWNPIEDVMSEIENM